MKEPEELKAEFSLERLEMEKYILVVLFLVQQRWGYIINKEFAQDGITTKQWLLTIVVANAFDHNPTIKEVAKGMGSSHQNVKQVALKLEQKGFIVMEKDPQDARITRIKLTDAVDSFGNESQAKAVIFTEKLFNGISAEELAITRSSLAMILTNLEKMDQESR